MSEMAFAESGGFSFLLMGGVWAAEASSVVELISGIWLDSGGSAVALLSKPISVYGRGGSFLLLTILGQLVEGEKRSELRFLEVP